MDPNYKFPASSGAPLNQVSPDRVNQQRYDVDTSARVRLFDQEQSHSRESSVHEKAAKFESLAFQGKALERRTNDAALKRAMLGREEAESEMRRYRDEARSLRKEVQEGKDRERKVGVRLENVMVSFNATKLNMMLILFRKTMAGRKRHTGTRKHCGKRKSGGHERTPLNHNLLSSNCKKNSKLCARN